MNDVSDFIAEKELPVRKILNYLRNLILQAAPKIIEKFSYQIPFYDYYGMLCYINVHKNGVDLGFCAGYLLSDEHNILEARNRKQVKTVTFQSVEEVIAKEETLRYILQEALLINEEKNKTRNKKQKR
jgi:hypothetical protein